MGKLEYGKGEWDVGKGNMSQVNTEQGNTGNWITEMKYKNKHCMAQKGIKE